MDSHNVECKVTNAREQFFNPTSLSQIELDIYEDCEVYECHGCDLEFYNTSFSHLCQECEEYFGDLEGLEEYDQQLELEQSG